MNLIKTVKGIVVAFGLSVTGAAMADPGLLDFEGLADLQPIGTYNGVDFGGNAIAVWDSDDGGLLGNIEGNPSPKTAMTFVVGGSVTLNVAAGFGTGFSLHYSASQDSPGAKVVVYDTLGGIGKILAELSLPPNFSDLCDPPLPGRGGDFCNWDLVSVEIDSGFTAKSVVFSGGANQIAFDDLTFGSAGGGCTTNCSVPEPGSLALVGAALLGLSAARRRKG